MYGDTRPRVMKDNPDNVIGALIKKTDTERRKRHVGSGWYFQIKTRSVYH